MKTMSKPRVPIQDEDEIIANMVEDASVPTLASLFKKARASNLIEDEQHYH